MCATCGVDCAEGGINPELRVVETLVVGDVGLGHRQFQNRAYYLPALRR
jgi:hypothetical protein